VRSKLIGLGLIIGLLSAQFVVSVPAVGTPAEASTGLKRPIEVTLKVSGWCDNTGSDVNIIGTIALGSVAMQVTLANNKKGTHLVSVVSSSQLTVNVAEEDSVFQKAPAGALAWKGEPGAVTGNPHALVTLLDTSGNPLVDADGNEMTYYLGRCVSGANGPKSGGLNANILEQSELDGLIATFIGALECSKKASQLGVKASTSQEGVNARLLLANQINKQPGEEGVHYADVAATVDLGLLGLQERGKGGKGWWDTEKTIHGPGGNPLVYSLSNDADLSSFDAKNESTWGAAHGRCNKLY